LIRGVKRRVIHYNRGSRTIENCAKDTTDRNFDAPTSHPPTVAEYTMKELEEFQWCAERLKALADPERLRIVAALLAGPKHVGVLAEELKDTVVKVSHHLGVLRHAGIVLADKQGRFVEYALHPDVHIERRDSTEENFLDLGCCRLALPATQVGR
jgi:DNA-binding transcriptional ArsR family regulator